MLTRDSAVVARRFKLSSCVSKHECLNVFERGHDVKCKKGLYCMFRFVIYVQDSGAVQILNMQISANLTQE